MRTWDTIAIIGVGLIGGSIGLALRERKLARRVIGIGRRRESLEKAVARGCVGEITTSIAEGVKQASLIVVSSPVESIAQHVLEASEHCPKGCVITDAGSTKAEIVAAAEQLTRVQFVGGHPLAGSEKNGCEAASADLFEGRVVVVTKTEKTDPVAARAIEEFWQSLGAAVLRMSPEEHDAALARTSHLPHLIAAALAAATPEQLLPLTATGWHDTTRIAAGDAELWRQILLANRSPTLKVLDDFEKVLSRIRAALESADGTLLAELLAEGKRRRDAVGN